MRKEDLGLRSEELITFSFWVQANILTKETEKKRTGGRKTKRMWCQIPKQNVIRNYWSHMSIAEMSSRMRIEMYLLAGVVLHTCSPRQ
jgi:hypothetical protein